MKGKSYMSWIKNKKQKISERDTVEVATVKKESLRRADAYDVYSRMLNGIVRNSGIVIFENECFGQTKEYILKRISRSEENNQYYVCVTTDENGKEIIIMKTIYTEFRTTCRGFIHNLTL